jgi:hypothetical protein
MSDDKIKKDYQRFLETGDDYEFDQMQMDKFEVVIHAIALTSIAAGAVVLLFAFIS